MRLYEAGVTKTTTAGSNAATLVAGTSRLEIREISIFSNTATAGEVQTGRPAANGSGALTGVLGQALDGSDAAALATLTTTFATAQPTQPTNPMRRIGLPA